MDNGFLRTASVSPELRVGDVRYNTEKITEVIRRAAADGVRFLVLPELALTGYTCGDLMLQRSLLEETERALLPLAAAANEADMVVCVGLPVVASSRLYNAAAVLANGRVLGVVPKSFLPTYSEFYEKRTFAEPDDNVTEVVLNGEAVPFGTKLLFPCIEMPDFVLGIEICEDMFVTISPGSRHSLAGATVIANLSASDEAVCKSRFRRDLVTFLSNKNVCCYVYCSAGVCESTGDVVFSGHDIAAENGALIAESEPFGEGRLVTELDLGRIAAERAHLTSVRAPREAGYRSIPFHLTVRETALTRRFPRRPFVPDDESEVVRRCREILAIQAHGLARRLAHTGCQKAVLGVSGGSDSTLALLVCLRAMELLQRPASDILAVSMPCFGTTKRTKNNAERMSTLCGATFREIDITASVQSHLRDLGHDGRPDVTYENAQARERMQVLMDLANMENGLVVGTGDMSEAALGWSTYNGDHMSMYAVNCSVPKTLVRRMIAELAGDYANELRDVLLDVVDTPVSPELLPPKDGAIAQVTEDIVGPYELHDFFLYYVIRWGFRPRKILLLAQQAFAEEYDRATILRWMRVFYRRFFQNQFKRSCVPDGPKVGSVALSPRGDWRMPSDASAALWLSEVDELAANA